MTILTWTYLTYLLIGGGATWWVAHALKRNGVVVLLDGTPRKPELAAAIADLLVVGFYLVNLGFISFMLGANVPSLTLERAIEVLSTKVGLVLVVLGIVHFLTVGVLAMARTSTHNGGRSVPADARQLL